MPAVPKTWELHIVLLNLVFQVISSVNVPGDESVCSFINSIFQKALLSQRILSVYAIAATDYLSEKGKIGSMNYLNLHAHCEAI